MADEPPHGQDDLVRDEEDHDLLTFAEGGIRLRDEIAQTEAALREDPPAERRAALQARLDALRGALERNTRQAQDSPGERGFLDYAPPGAGNTAAEPSASSCSTVTTRDSGLSRDKLVSWDFRKVAGLSRG